MVHPSWPRELPDAYRSWMQDWWRVPYLPQWQIHFCLGSRPRYHQLWDSWVFKNNWWRLQQRLELEDNFCLLLGCTTLQYWFVPMVGLSTNGKTWYHQLLCKVSDVSTWFHLIKRSCFYLLLITSSFSICPAETQNARELLASAQVLFVTRLVLGLLLGLTNMNWQVGIAETCRNTQTLLAWSKESQSPFQSQTRKSGDGKSIGWSVQIEGILIFFGAYFFAGLLVVSVHLHFWLVSPVRKAISSLQLAQKCY